MCVCKVFSHHLSVDGIHFFNYRFFISYFNPDHANSHLYVSDRNQRGGASGRKLLHDFPVSGFLFLYFLLPLEHDLDVNNSHTEPRKPFATYRTVCAQRWALGVVPSGIRSSECKHHFTWHCKVHTTQTREPVRQHKSARTACVYWKRKLLMLLLGNYTFKS